MGVTVIKSEKKEYPVLGIDPSTKTGFAFLNGLGYQHTGLITFPKLKGMARVHAIVSEVKEVVLKEKPKLVMIEGYGYANAHSLALLVEIGGAIRHLLWEMGVPYLEIPPNNLKQYTTGSGATKKDLMLLEVFKRWGEEIKDDNIADAYALAKMGVRVLSGDKTGETQKHSQAFTKLEMLKQGCSDLPEFKALLPALKL